ncbi:MAG: glycosyltransferase [Gemmatimonadetes bacterium]|nr:glycosyltransferase [Gemmatimonadota bacterium]
MRVLFAHNLAPWDSRSGGGQRVQHQIASALSRRGHEVRALFLGSPPPPPEPVPYRWHPVREHRRLLNNVGALADATDALVATWMPDAAYLSSPESIGVLSRLPGRTGVLATSHHPDPPHLPRLTWRLAQVLSEARRLQPFYYERAVLRRAHRRSAVSSYGRDVLVERGYLRPETPVRVIHNALDPYWLRGAERAGGAAAPRSRRGFLFVGRMDQQKGIDVLLDAYEASAANWPLTLMGDGPERGALEARAQELGVANRVTFLGHGTRDQVRSAMEAAGALVAPSRAENYPMVLLEAMAVGLPVVATRVGGVPEMITHLESGLLLDHGDRKALERAMTLLSEDPGLRARLAGGGASVAARHEATGIIDAIVGELRASMDLARGRAPSREAKPHPGPLRRPPVSFGPSHPRKSRRTGQGRPLAALLDAPLSGRPAGPRR